MEDSQELRQEISERLSQSQGYWNRQYMQSEWALRFASGDQWPEEVKQARVVAKMPMMTVNFTRPFVNRVVNPFRLSPFAVDIGADDPSVGDVLTAFARGIELDNRLSEKAEIALENAVTCGIGFICVGVDYANKKSQDRKVSIYSPSNPLTYWLDPFSVEVDGSDAEFGFGIRYLDEKVAEANFGKDVQGEAFSVDMWADWTIPDGKVPEFVYYRKTRKSVTRNWFADGKMVDGDKVVGAISKRKIEVISVEVARFIGHKLVEETTLPISSIPIVPVFGDRVHDIEGVQFVGVPWWVKDSQIQVNYYASAESLLAQRSPSAPFIVEKGQVADYKAIWSTANTVPHSYLPYKAVSVNGVPIGAPQRVDNQAQTGGLIASRQAAQMDMARSVSMFDQTFGAAETNASGIAVMRTQSAGEIGAAQYADNLRKSLLQVWRIIMELSESVYDTKRRMKVVNESGEVAYLDLNISEVLKATPYEIEISSGPVHESRKREGVEQLMGLAQMMPDKMPLIADLIVKDLPVPYAKQISKRFASTLPPEVLEPKAVDPQAQAALQQAEATLAEQQQVIGQMEQMIAQLQNALIANEQSNEAKIQVAVINAEADLAQEQIKQAGQDKRLAAEIAASNHEQNKSILAKAAEKDADDAMEMEEEARNMTRSGVNIVDGDVLEQAEEMAQNAPPTAGNAGMLSED